MDIELPERKKPKLKEDVERIFLKSFSHSPDLVDEIYDSLEHCDMLIHYYLDATASISSTFKDRINRLSLRSNNIFLDFDELYMLIGEYIDKIKKQVLLGAEAAFSQKEILEFQQRFEKIKADVVGIVTDLRKYTDDVDKYETRYG